ncbi:NAD(P)/FAD-dependent oxidoreductase [Nakamurella silvestris]|nr:NAD(P)/FAD-dependent oxidoreductase [Nakamurella silvestris]
MIDLLVVGAGPAGLGTAIQAARAGLRTVVLDPRTGPIEKACAEGLMPHAVRRLEDMGVRLTGMPFAGIHYQQGERILQTRFRHGAGLGCRRLDLSAALFARAASLGVEVLPRTVEEIEQTENTVTAGGLTARYLAAADGLHSPVRRRLGLDRPVSGVARHGLRQHFAVPPWTDLVEVHWGREAEVYVTPIAPDLVSVAVLSSVTGGFEHHLSAFPELAARLPVGATKVRGAGPLRQRSASRVAGRVLLVGDAAGYVDALTGEGIAIALASGEALVECVAADRPGDYEKQWRLATRRYRRLTEAMVRVARTPSLRNLLVPALGVCPPLFRAGVNTLAS